MKIGSISIVVIVAALVSTYAFTARKAGPAGRPPRAHLVALNVGSVDRSVRWYADNLGFELKDRKEFPQFGVRIALLQLDGFWLEIVEKKSGIPVSTIKKAIPEIKDWDDVQGIKKLAFEVDSLDAYLTRFKQRGVQVQFGPSGGPEDPIFGRSLIVHDDDGNWIQLCELNSSSKKR